jgi:four helix bundle protein
MLNDKINNFTDLKVWQEAHKLALDVYKITENFPKQEIFGLTSQLRRAAVSVSSNIAEGFGRASPKEKLHFYSIARGSVYEIQSQLMLSKDLNYFNFETFEDIFNQLTYTNKILSAFIRSTKLL